MHNSDSSKTIMAQAQTYFVMQTRRAEKELDELTEYESKRLVLRRERPIGEITVDNRKHSSII